MKIAGVAAILKMIEQDSSLNQKIKVQFPECTETPQELLKVIPEINQERHPILHLMVSLKAYLKNDE